MSGAGEISAITYLILVLSYVATYRASVLSYMLGQLDSL